MRPFVGEKRRGGAYTDEYVRWLEACLMEVLDKPASLDGYCDEMDYADLCEWIETEARPVVQGALGQ